MHSQATCKQYRLLQVLLGFRLCLHKQFQIPICSTQWKLEFEEKSQRRNRNCEEKIIDSVSTGYGKQTMLVWNYDVSKRKNAVCVDQPSRTRRIAPIDQITIKLPAVSSDVCTACTFFYLCRTHKQMIQTHTKTRHHKRWMEITGVLLSSKAGYDNYSRVRILHLCITYTSICHTQNSRGSHASLWPEDVLLLCTLLCWGGSGRWGWGTWINKSSSNNHHLETKLNIRVIFPLCVLCVPGLSNLSFLTVTFLSTISTDTPPPPRTRRPMQS